MSAPTRDFCFVHAADLHLGGRRWMRRMPTDTRFAEQVRGADRLALGRLVDLCLSEQAALLVCAGDIVDGWCRDHRVGLELVRELSRLRGAQCDVVFVLGNHDVRTRVVRPLLFPEHVTLLGLTGPETRRIDRLGVALHGWSVVEPVAAVDVAEQYPPPIPELLNVGLLHTSAEGASGHVRYAPCSRRTLRRSGYDYWALGHVHTRQIVASSPWIVFPGNLQGRGVREPGPKGATLVRVRDGRIASAEHRSLDAVRFDVAKVDTSASAHFDDVLSAAEAALRRILARAEERPVVAKLVLSGEAGAGPVLNVPPKRRRAAFQSVLRRLGNDRACIDETWIDVPDVGAWWIDVAA